MNLKYLNQTLAVLANEVKTLRGKGADAASQRAIETLYRKVTQAQNLMSGECPKVQYADFSVAEPTVRAAGRTAARKAAKKKTRRTR